MTIQLIGQKSKLPPLRMVQRSQTEVVSPPASLEQQAYARSQIVPRRSPTYHAPNILRALTLSTAATPFGCCNFFDRCNDEIMSLHFGGTLGLLDWMNFQVSDECYKVLEFISYNRPANGSAGYLADPCADPNGIEYGTSKLTLEDFGRYGRTGPTRDIMKPKRFCATDPVRRLDGVPVTSEREWDMRFATDVILQDINRHSVTGNAAVPGQFGGLEYWVKNGYPGPNGKTLDSIVINWAGNNLAGAGGGAKTWNGAAIAAAFEWFDVLKAAVRNIKQRISWARQLANQPMMLGDMILALPTFLGYCVLDAYACYTICGGGQFTPVNLQQSEVRTFRDNLVRADNPSNLFGAGYITIDNMDIPLMNWDWGLIKGPQRGDIYLLTGAIGGVRIWEGEHLSAETAASEYGELGYESFDEGRMLGTVVTENECRLMKFWMHPRMFCRAPWTQIRFADVECDTPGTPLSPDPTETSFFPQGSSFTPAVC
jgi:hypothetical protein